VQRYTSLATLFFLVALYSYIRGRMKPEPLKAYLWWSTMLGAFLLSLGSKENAALWPASVLLVEWIFFRGRDGKPSPYFFKLVVAATFLSLIVVGGLLTLFQIDLVKAVLHGFDGRPFSLTERVMTQPRVIVYYLSQIFYPIPQRLSLEHDFIVSTDLLHPWTTLPAVFAVGLLAAAGLNSARRRPVIGFAILFFLINHLVESTALPLEMVFEHRNYLPSLFLFWPLVTGGLHLRERLRRRHSSLQSLVPVAAVSLILIFAMGTFSRNLDWRTERSLWVDTFRKAPQSARAAVNLANDLARNGHHDQAAELYNRATTLSSPKINQFKVVARSNLATMYQNMGQPQKALDEWARVLDIVPHNRPGRLGLANLHLALGQYVQAETQIDWLLKRHPREAVFLSTKASLLIRQNRPEEALAVLRRALAESPGHRDIIKKIGVAYAMLGRHDRADWFFRQALQTAPHDLGIQLVRLENSMEEGRTKFSNALIARILGRYPIDTIWARLDSSKDEVRQPAKLRHIFGQHLDKKAQTLENIDKRHKFVDRTN
jgi:tetratricopeptide (TPR) repeat protein